MFWTGVRRQCYNFRRLLHRFRPRCRSSLAVVREVIVHLRRGITLWIPHGVLGCVPDVSSGLSPSLLWPLPRYPWKIIPVCLCGSPQRSWGAFPRAPGVPSTVVLVSYLREVRLRLQHVVGQIGLDKKGDSSFHLCTACPASASGFGHLHPYLQYEIGFGLRLRPIACMSAA